MTKKDFTNEQFCVFAYCMKIRFAENPSIFRLIEPPYHSMNVALSPSIDMKFQGKIFGDLIIMDGTTMFKASAPNIITSPIKFIKYVVAYRRMWNIAETLLNQRTASDAADKLLYSLFPEILEKDITK